MARKPSIYWLLVFIPITLALEHAGVRPPLVFFAAALAIIPIASLIVRATEQLAERTGDAIGGLLNATFGNAPELIIATVALRAGLFDMVRASLVGAILANLLLALGVAFLVGGLRYHTQEYNATASRVYTSMMFIAVASLAVPSAFSRIATTEATMLQEQRLNVVLAVILLAAYVLYLVFMIKTHPDHFKSVATGEDHHEGKGWSVARALVSLLVASALAAWMSEILVGAAGETGKALGLSEIFIGIIFLAVVGGAAESGAAVTAAHKNRMDLAVSIAMGSCIQIALFVAPLLVLASAFVAPRPLMLAFGRVELWALMIAVLIGGVVANDGRANWYKGVQLLCMYAIMILVFFLLPVIK